MKYPTINKDYIGSCCGLLRLGTIGFGGAVFGTLAENDLLVRPTAHVLMWVAVFAWVVSTGTFLAGLHSHPLFANGTEYRVNLMFAIFYLIAAIVYGIWDINMVRFSGMALLVFIFAAVTFIFYFLLGVGQLCDSDAGKKIKDGAKARKAEKKAKKPGKDDKQELKEEIQAEEGVSADPVVENGEGSRDEEPEAQQAQQEEVKVEISNE